jgi:hypothetical protein
MRPCAFVGMSQNVGSSIKKFNSSIRLIALS